jgi:GntR family transcriptional regulator
MSINSETPAFDLSALLATIQANSPDRTTRVPLYVQSARAIQQALKHHNPPTNQPLPPERDLACALSVSRPTLRHALSYLADLGWIYARQGIGTFAAPRVMTRPLGLSSLYQYLKDSGLHPATRVLRLSMASADETVAHDLNIVVGAPVVNIERLRLARDKPVALIDTQLYLKGETPFTKVELEADGLHNLLRIHYGIQVSMGAQWVRARLASQAEVELLQLFSPAAVLVIRRILFDTAGHGVEISTIVFPESAQFFERRLLSPLIEA